MIEIKQNLSEKDKLKIKILLGEIVDTYGDFYITKSNLRLYIKENPEVLYKLLSKGDKILFDEEGEGLAVIIGYAEKSPRKYLKLLAKNEKIADKIIKNVNWNVLEELYCKIKKTNPIKNILLKNRWKFAGDRGKEVLLKREKIESPKKENKYAFKSEN